MSEPDTMFLARKIAESQSTPEWVDRIVAELGLITGTVSHVFQVDDEWKTIEKPSEFVEAVIEVIKRQGWWRSGYGNAHTGQVCVLGAMNLVATGIVDSLCTSHPLWHAVRERIETTLCGHLIPYWNDYRARDRDHVIDMLTQVAKSFRDEGN